MSDETTEAGVGDRAGCGCKIGDLHRYGCAGVGRVDPPRPPRPAAPDAGDASEGLTPAEWEAITEASWNGGSKAWRAEIERTIAAREAAARADERERIARRLETEWRTFALAGHEAGVVAARIARGPR